MGKLKVEVDVLLRVDALASRRQVTKSAAVVAVFSEGLQTAHRLGVGRDSRIK
jgi:hypothetical protein